MIHDPKFDELAMAYLTGDISPADMVDFELRLKADASARSRLAELSEQEMALRQIFVQHENHRQLPPDSSVLPEVADTRRGGKSGVMRARRSRAMRTQRTRRRSNPFWIPLTLAASFLLFVLLFFMQRQTPQRPGVAHIPNDPTPPTPPRTHPGSSTPEVKTPKAKPVGSVVFVATKSGQAPSMSVRRVEGDREQRLPLVEGMPVLAGDKIDTGPRDSDVAEHRPVRAAVEFSTGTTLDLADETNLEAVSEGEVKMDSGLLYAQTRAELTADALTVRTPHANVKSERVAMDVSVATDSTAVAVESGSAEVRNDKGSTKVAAVGKSITRRGEAPTLPVTIYAANMWRGRKGPAAFPPVKGELAVLSFTLIDADRDMPIEGFDPLPAGEVVLNLAKLPTRNLNIRANTVPKDGISVRFVSSKRPKPKLEQFAPYAFNGDRFSDYDAWTPELGTHVITATPFPDHYGRKPPGKELRIKIRVIDQ